ncbi:MAG: guanylate kinase [Clostridia bacterium]|nr:guanylate kinase [Clostridia bacterium]
MHGETYIFVDNEEFKKLITQNALYEFDIHHNHYYGVPKKQLNERIKEGKIVIKDVDVNGTENLVKILRKDMKVVTIFLKVPKEELRKRLESRIDKPSEEEINLRLSRFDFEESKIENYDYIIENTDLEKTIEKVIEIINNN